MVLITDKTHTSTTISIIVADVLNTFLGLNKDLKHILIVVIISVWNPGSFDFAQDDTAVLN